MAKRRVTDFDAIRKEQAAKPIEFRAYGLKITLPPKVPGKAQLLVNRLRKLEDDDTVDFEQLVEVFEAFMGKEQFAQILDSPEFSFDDAGDLFKSLLLAYADGSGSEGEAKPPTTGATP